MTAKRYKLPDVLGGGEVDGDIDFGWQGRPTGFVRVTIGASGEYMVLNPDRLTEVPPPIPTEPEPGVYMVGSAVAVHNLGCVVNWYWVHDDDVHEGTWSYLWSEIGAGLTAENIRRLVPESDPLPEVTLPWAGTDASGCEIFIAPYGDRVGVLFRISGASHPLSRDRALAMGAALIASAASTQGGAS